MSEPVGLDTSLRSAFAGRNVLVTGHTGFKGGWLCLWLTMLGARVRGVALPPGAGPSLFTSLGLAELVDHRIADIRDKAAFRTETEDFSADIVFHLAAQSLVRRSYDDPLGTLGTNVMGTATVLEQVRRMPSARGVVVVSSDKCYDNKEWCWPYREIDPMGGADPYSASKGCTELIADCYRRSFFDDPARCQLASVRAGNVFGGGDWSLDRLVPDIIRANLSCSPVTIRNPESVRPWQHVLEPLSGYLQLGARLLSDEASKFAEAWNFGPSADAFVRVEDLARGMQAAWGPDAAPIELGRRVGDPHEATMLTLDSSKALKRLGWRSQISTKEAISMTAAWYVAHAEGQEDMRAFTELQVARYSDAPIHTLLHTEDNILCA